MEAFTAFILAFIFSLVGSIPPGTLNLTIIQLGLEHRINTAWRFALATALIEIPYAWIAIEFENLIETSPTINDNFQLITGIVMIMLGIINLRAAKSPSKFYKRFNDSGFRRGIILGILNPMALPFWIAMTAYMKNEGWIQLATGTERFFYLLGASIGALVLFMLLAFTAKKVISQFQGNTLLRKSPGIMLILLGVYALLQYLL